MSYRTIESNFEYQAKIILMDALKGSEIKNLDDVELFEEEIWKDNFAKEIGKKFMEKLSEYSGEDVYQDVMEELKEI